MNQTIASDRPVAVVAGLNERNLMGSLKHLFAGSMSVIGELMQNARRADASRIDIEASPAEGFMAISDNGSGIENFQDLITLAQSGWDEETMLADRPFGMGLFSVLFAAARITFRSRARSLTVSLQDVIEKRKLYVTADAGAPSVGSRIELHDLASELRQTTWRNGPGAILPDSTQERTEYVLGNAIRIRAAGFPIPVFVNGIEVERPRARAHLAGEMTNIGFVSIPGIHHQGDQLIPILPARSSVATYLQGLPIGPICDSTATCVVHLCNDRFTAKMPDRVHLYDQAEAEGRIGAALKSLVLEFLQREKDTLPPEEFVQRHWQNCENHNAIALMNDVPFVPVQTLCKVGQVSNYSDDVFQRRDRWNSTPGGKVVQELVGREAIASGLTKVWHDAPSYTSEDRAAALVLKLMQREEISTPARLDRGHWIYTCTPSVSDLLFEVTPVAPKGDVLFHSNDGFDGVYVTLVEAVQVVVTSRANSTLRLELEVKDDWIIVPNDYLEAGFDSDSQFEPWPARCFITPSSKAPDHPVDAMSSYRDENDDYRDEWRDRDLSSFKAVVSGLLGESISVVVQTALNAAAQAPSDSHAGQMAIVRSIRRRWGDEDRLTDHQFNVVCAQDPAFWARVAQQFEASVLVDSSLADRLKAAFTAVVEPGATLKMN